MQTGTENKIENYFMGKIVDNTLGEIADPWINKAIRTSLGTDGSGGVPEPFNDLITAIVINIEGENRVIIHPV